MRYIAGAIPGWQRLRRAAMHAGAGGMVAGMDCAVGQFSLSGPQDDFLAATQTGRARARATGSVGTLLCAPGTTHRGCPFIDAIRPQSSFNTVSIPQFALYHLCMDRHACPDLPTLAGRKCGNSPER